MIIVMKQGASPSEVEHVCQHIRDLGYQPHPIYGTERVVIGAIGDERSKKPAQEALSLQSGVESVTLILKPYKRVGLELRKDRTVVRVGEGAGAVTFGGSTFVVIAGPCSVETEDQLLATARAVKESGARILRGGAFKPRTSPYAFQGLADEGLRLLVMAREETGLPFVTEVVNVRDVELVARYADMLQIGARNMQNFGLLREAGQTRKPIMLKRGLSATLEELLMSAEYIANEGNERIVLCERGIRTFEPYTRNTLDLSAIPVVHSLSHLPIIADPSHGTGRRDLIGPMVNAAVACGADGVMIEVHPSPETAFSDGAQSIVPEEFARIMADARCYAAVAGRTV